MKKKKWKSENIAYPVLKTVFFVGSLLFIGAAVVIILTSDEIGLFIGLMGIASAYLAMLVTVMVSEATIDELKKKLNKITKKLEKKKS